MAATWKKGYLQGSFRGVTFFLDSADYSGGRRLATHLFPERDDAQHEDLGRSVRQFSLSIYIVGDNYFQQRENMIEALEKKGPGILIHPYRGVIRVVCRNFVQREVRTEGRMTRFEVNFENQENVLLTTVTRNTAAEIYEKKKSLLSAIKEAFADAYNITNQPSAVLQDAVASVNSALTLVEDLKKVVGSYAEFQRQLSNLRGLAIRATLDAVSLADSLGDIISFGTDPESAVAEATEIDGPDRVREMLNLSKTDTIPNTDTPPNIYTDTNHPSNQISNLVKQLSIASATGLVPVIPLDTIGEAEALRADIFAVLDGILDDPGTSDAVFGATNDSKKAINDELNRRILDLSRVVSYFPVVTEPTIKIVNEIYGNLEKENELIERNKILHPGFVQGGQELKVELDG